MFLRLSIAVLAASICLAGSAGLSGPGRQAAATTAESPRTGDIVVRFEADATLGEVGDALADAGAQAKASSGGSRLVLVSPEAGQSVDDAVVELASSDGVVFAEPDHVVSIADTVPNDPYYAGYQWNLPQIGLPAAWDTTTGGSPGTIVAVIDTGVSTTHPELSGNLVAGRNVIAGTSNANDDHGHGTNVAGIIAAVTNNNSQMAGVCWTCRIMPIKALASDGFGSTFNVAVGIDWAVDNGARIVNLSLGTCSGDSSLQTAVNRATAPPFNAVVIAASGNYDPVGNPPGACVPEEKVMFPAAYPNVIAVGASTQGGARASFSSYGPELDIVAPGEGIVVAALGNPPGGPFGGWGTSFAAPHVAGVAGLLMAAGITDRAEITDRMISTATDLAPAGPDVFTGAGRVNAAAALSAPDTTPPAVAITAPANGATVSGIVNIFADAVDDEAITRVWFYVDGFYLRSDALAPYAAAWNTSEADPGPHTILVRAYDSDGNFSEDAINVTVSDASGPSVTITSPANGANVPGSVNIVADATDPDGVQRVWFYIDGVYLRSDALAPYSAVWDASSSGEGGHTVRVRAYDLSGNFTDETIGVNVGDATPPNVIITAPSNGATVSGVVNIAANVTDDTGVQRVWFYLDGVYLRSDALAPYSAAWDASGAAPGPHQIRVRAYDTNGNFTDGTITVNAA